MRLQSEADGTRTRNLRIDSPVRQGSKWEPVKSYSERIGDLHQRLHQRNDETTKTGERKPLRWGVSRLRPK